MFFKRVKEVLFYQNDEGNSQILDWLSSLDIETKSRIIDRITRVKSGNFGDYKKIVGHKKLFELRFKFGSGYRIYFTQRKGEIILLLQGGDKSTQTKDIKKAANIIDKLNQQ